MRRRFMAAAGVVPSSAADSSDTISDSGSSTSAPPPQLGRRRRQTNSVSQVARAGAPVVPTTPGVGQSAVVVEEMASQVGEGSSSAAAARAAINRCLGIHGQIPMTRSEETPDDDDVDLNALLSLAPPNASRRRRQVVDRPVICAYCNCAFCFAPHDIPPLNPVPGRVYPAPRVPITRDLLTPPAVWPLHRGDPWAPGATPEWLLVCSCENHFKATMGMLQHQLPPLVWKCAIHCLRVLPVVVGSQGSNSPDRFAPRAPPPDPCRYAGAYWNYVEAGDEDMVKLKLHEDPLELTLGRR